MSQFIRTNWSKQPWIFLAPNDLEDELAQCRDEGIDISGLADEFSALATLDLLLDEYQQRAEALLERIQTLPIRADYPYQEPIDLLGIRAARPVTTSLPQVELSDDTLYNKVLGAWLGRIAGCLLGKPVEGRKGAQIEQYLRAQGRWPLNDYFSFIAPDDIKAECNLGTFADDHLYVENINGMPEDDDTNYTVCGLAILKQYGANFTPADVGTFWLSNIPFMHTYVTERIAYRNLVVGIGPPDSARVHNPTREGIGARIRADFYGYACPGNPELAADFAWRDGCISHVKNGLYSAMSTAAMLATGYVCDDMVTVIRAGLAQMPANCRLAAAIEHVLQLYALGVCYEDAIADMRTRWKEESWYWVHAISNAEIVIIALLWGEKDFDKTICYSVLPGFDTDCNGATAGSILGMVLGASAIPAKWTSPLHDSLTSGVSGYHRVAISELASESVALIRKIQQSPVSD